MTEQEFEQKVGRKPEQDDLERANCPIHGLGHDHCGICEKCGYPRFIPNFGAMGLRCNHREN